MKKIMSVLLAVVMVAGLMALQASSVKNLMLITDEDAKGEIRDGTYVTEMREGRKGLEWGCWNAGGYKKGIFNIDTNIKKFGKQSLNITLTAKDQSCITLYVPNLQKNKDYTLIAWMKIEKVMSADLGASMAVDFFTDKHSPVKNGSFVTEPYTGTKDWKRISLTFKSPNVDFYCPLIQLSLSNATGKVWFDGIAFIEGKVAVDDSKIENPKGPTPTPVPDVPSSWAKAEVDEAVAAKLVPSALQSKYTSSITRSDFCDLVVNMIQVKSGKTIAEFVKTATGKDLTDKPFPDTTSANVNAASKLGIVNGRTNGNFDPNGLITRQEAAKMLALTAKALGQDITATAASFADGAKIADWAKEYVSFVSAKGVMGGTGNNNFSPAANYTREQSFLTILRLFKALA